LTIPGILELAMTRMGEIANWIRSGKNPVADFPNIGGKNSQSDQPKPGKSAVRPEQGKAKTSFGNSVHVGFRF